MHINMDFLNSALTTLIYPLTEGPGPSKSRGITKFMSMLVCQKLLNISLTAFSFAQLHSLEYCLYDAGLNKGPNNLVQALKEKSSLREKEVS